MPTMRMRSKWLLVLGVVLATLCFSIPVQAEKPLDLEDMVKILQKVGTYQNKETPKALSTKNAPLDRGGYDPNAFLALFPRLSLDKGQVLDFVYDYQGLGGHPVVYARLQDQAAYANLAEFKKNNPRRYFIGDNVRFDATYLSSIRTDDTPDGFLQLAMCVLTGEQFYILWHAAYYALTPILDRNMLDKIADSLPEKLRDAARAVDFTPRVTMGPEEVRVEYVVFGAWSGIKRFSWTVKRAFPHRFVKVEEDLLLKYDNPLRF